MKFIIVILFSIIVAALQLTAARSSAIFSVAPDLISAGALAWALWRREGKEWWPVFVFVLFFDILAGRPFGLLTFSLWLMIFFIEMLGSVIFKQGDLPAILFLTVIGILSFEIFYVFSNYLLGFFRLTDIPAPSFFYFYAVLPVKVIYNGGAALLFLGLLNRLRLSYGQFFEHQ